MKQIRPLLRTFVLYGFLLRGGAGTIDSLGLHHKDLIP